MRIISYSKEAIQARQRYALKKERENDTIPLATLKKRIRLQHKKEERLLELEKMESNLFSQSVLGMTYFVDSNNC